MISMAGPAAAIRDVRVTQRGSATAISLLGTGRLVASNVQEETKGAHRLVIDLPNVTSSVKDADRGQAGTGGQRAHRAQPEVGRSSPRS